MELQKNKFIQKLKEKPVTYGCWVGLPDNTCAEIMAGAGFDWLLIDNEHAPYDLRTTMSHLQVLAAYDVAPIVRPVVGDTALIKQLLDIGAQTLLVPMVDTAEQARELVRATRYPPQGIRGLGASLARGAQWNRTPGYLHKANDEICLIVQAETVTAIENLDEIIAVEGVDGVFIGPSDLSASMGHVGNAGHPDVVATIKEGLKKIKAAGKFGGLLNMDPSLTQAYIDAGATFVGVGVDTSMLAQASKALADKYCNPESAANAPAKPSAGY